jgi:hypothetical protein
MTKQYDCMNEEYTFTCKGDNFEFTYRTKEQNWREIVDCFVCFLRGCGFVIPDVEIKEVEDGAD